MKTKQPAVETAAPESQMRHIRIEMVENGYVVRIGESEPSAYHEATFVFTTQGAMIKAVKEATTMKVGGEEE